MNTSESIRRSRALARRAEALERAGDFGAADEIRAELALLGFSPAVEPDHHLGGEVDPDEIRRRRERARIEELRHRSEERWVESAETPGLAVARRSRLMVRRSRLSALSNAARGD